MLQPKPEVLSKPEAISPQPKTETRAYRPSSRWVNSPEEAPDVLQEDEAGKRGYFLVVFEFSVRTHMSLQVHISGPSQSLWILKPKQLNRESWPPSP